MSHVVHVSLDPTVPVSDPKQVAEDEEDDEADPENDPDQVIKNARPAQPGDGLLQPDEFTRLFSSLPPLRSAYDEWGSIEAKRSFGSRVELSENRRGRGEPKFTSITHYWKTTLGSSKPYY